VSSLRVLFLTDRYDAPYRYRCSFACEQLRNDGVRANVMRSDDPGVLPAIDAYSVVVLFRLPWSAGTEAIVKRARQSKVPLVFDVDDLVFDPDSSDLMPFRSRYSQAAWEKSYGRELRALRRTLEACDLAVVSTPALAEHVERLGKPARVHPNLVPPLYLNLARRTARARGLLGGVPTLGYFSGSNTHDADFAAIAAPLSQVLHEHREARLLVCGYLDEAPLLRAVAARIVRLPYLSWRVYPWALAACNAALAPLSTINAFTDGKSALKFFEAGALGVPIVATPAREFARAIEHGVDGWLARTESEWRDALSQALDAEQSARLGAAARRTVLKAHSFDAQRGKLREILESIAATAKGRLPAERALAWDEYSGRPGKLAEARAQGRRTVELASLMRTLAKPVAAGPDPEAVAAWLAAPPPGSGAALLVAGDPERSGWRPSEQLSAAGALPGELRVSGADPHWISDELSLPVRARYLALRLRALAEGTPVRAQLFWATARSSGFSEARSVYIPLTTDGIDHTYVIDLWSAAGGASLKRARKLRLRFDPLDAKGVVGIGALALLPADFVPPAPQPLAESATELALPEKRKHALLVLGRAFGNLQNGQRVSVLSTRGPDWLRDALAEAAGDFPIRVDTLGTRGRFAVAEIVGAARPGGSGVDVVVPVFNARKQTLRCLRSVLRHAKGDFRLVVIDDASTDPKLWPRLEEFARERARVILLRNPNNLGFSATVNRGIELAGGRDVLVLNSDTKVFADFLGRLREAAYADPRTGIVCPLSNNATICSAPDFCRDNPLPPGVSGKQLARLVRRIAQRERPELVTPVGFCMYLRHDLLEDVGRFDAGRYGRGFGEENDLGERAKARGWRIRLADDVYVLHEGKASFGELGQSLEKTNARVLEAQHPGYHAAVAEFIRANPLASIHARMRSHIKRRSHDTEPAPLELLHSSPFSDEAGGTEQVVRDLVRALRLPRVVLAYPGDAGIEVAEVIDGDVGAPLRYSFPLATPVPRFAHAHAEAESALARILELFRVGVAHVHHFFYWPLSIARVFHQRGVPYLTTQHDFYAICPSANLLDHSKQQRCCPLKSGDPEQVAVCLRALCRELALEAPAEPAQFLAEHRAAFAEALAGAERVLFPSPSAASLVAGVHADRRGKHAVLPHGYDLPRPKQREPGQGPLRVALLGEVAYASKGADEYLRVIRECSGTDIEWHVFGTTERFGFDQRLDAAGGRVVRHGPYRRAAISELLTSAQIDVGLLLPICPETFSLTLSELLGAGIPVVASPQGALADRLSGQPYGILVRDAGAAAEALRGLASRGPRLHELQAAAQAFQHTPVASWADAHRELYAKQLKRAPKAMRAPWTGAELRELEAARIKAPDRGSSVSTTQPNSRYTSSWWFPWASKVKPYVPEALRAFARRQLAADGLRSRVRWRLPGPGAALGAQLRVVRRYLATTMLESLGTDPHLLLDSPPLWPDSVQAVRFNLWCSHPSAAFAQLYWRHAGDPSFSEEKSITIPLDARAAAWQEYVVRFDALERSEAWRDGGQIVALRFDPINLPGLIGLGELAVCGAPPQLGAKSD